MHHQQQRLGRRGLSPALLSLLLAVLLPARPGGGQGLEPPLEPWVKDLPCPYGTLPGTLVKDFPIHGLVVGASPPGGPNANPYW